MYLEPISMSNIADQRIREREAEAATERMLTSKRGNTARFQWFGTLRSILRSRTDQPLAGVRLFTKPMS